MAENIKCPFRQDEHGEFKPCYKEKCMAYFDMKQFSLHLEDAPEQPCCRKLMPQSPPYGGGWVI